MKCLSVQTSQGSCSLRQGAIALLHPAAQCGKGVRRPAKAGARATESSGRTHARPIPCPSRSSLLGELIGGCKVYFTQSRSR